MRTGFRFDPPALEPTAEQAWVLARAFGPPSLAFDGAVDSRRALEAAAHLALTARLGARNDRDALAAEVGDRAADRFVGTYRAAAARSVASEGLCRQLAAVGVDEGVPTIFLKGAALQLGGYTPHGWRESCDVDVLVPSDAAVGYQRALIARGFEEQAGIAAEHQMLPVRHQSGLVVEVHTLLRGVRVDDRGGSATGEELMSRGLCRTAGEAPSGMFLPAEDALACHLLVHGIAQHGLSPGSYPMSRLIADVADLAASGLSWDRVIGGSVSWIANDVSEEEIRAVVGLAARLGSGERAAEIVSGSDHESRLLRHVLAGALDDDYRTALKLRHYSDPLAGSTKTKTLLRNAWYAVWISDPQVEELYGTPSSRLGYFGWKLWRPVDVAIRAGRYGRAWARHRLRRRRQARDCFAPPGSGAERSESE